MNWQDLAKINAEVEQDDRVPSGYRTIVLKAYTDGKTIVFPEQPAWKISDDDEYHNCDEWGCGTFHHVMRMIPVLPEWVEEIEAGK